MTKKKKPTKEKEESAPAHDMKKPFLTNEHWGERRSKRSILASQRKKI
jgi:hypothetical protein